MRGWDCSIKNLFEAHYPTKHTITPYNSSDADLTATAAAAAHSESAWHILFSARQQHPMTAVRVVNDLLATPLLAAAVLALATLDEVQRHKRDDQADEGFPRAKRTVCSRKRRDKDVLEHSKQLNAAPLESCLLYTSPSPRD